MWQCRTIQPELPGRVEVVTASPPHYCGLMTMIAQSSNYVPFWGSNGEGGSEGGGNPTDCVFIAFVRIEVRGLRARAEEDGCMLAVA